MASLADVARAAGVSKATASRALSDAAYVAPSTRERVLAAAADLGYVVSSSAASLVTGRSHTIGVVTPFINRWFFAEVLEGVEAELNRRGYDLTLYRVADDADHRRRVFDYFLQRKRVDAVITIGLALSPAEIDLLRALGRPHVAVGPAVQGVTSLSIDDRAVGRLVTEHLLGLGHLRLVHLGGGRDEQVQFHAHAARLRGFRDAIKAAGLEHDGDVRITPYTVEGGYEVALELLADPRARPTGIVAGCDEIAIGAITAARQLGILVPSQLSVVGVDDHTLAEMFGLTTVRQDPREQGEHAVQLVLADDADDRLAPPRVVEMPTSLRVRASSTAPAPLAVAG